MVAPPPSIELAEECNLTTKQVRDYLEKSRTPLSLDLKVGDNQGTPKLVELLEDDGQTPEDFCDPIFPKK